MKVNKKTKSRIEFQKHKAWNNKNQLRETPIVFLIIMMILVSCSSDKQSSDDLPFLNVKKNYPEKEFILTDVADITFSHLSSENNDFLFSNPFGESISSFTKNTIVVQDINSGTILFFSRDGSPISRFNHVGQGSEEYILFFNGILHDEDTDDVYIYSKVSDRIQVYSSKGEYRRTLTLPEGVKVSQMASFDERSVLVFKDNSALNAKKRFLEEEPIIYADSYADSIYILISKTDGEVLDYINVPSGTIDVSEFTDTHRKTGEILFGYRPIAHILKYADGFLLCNPETDTVFFCDKDKLLTPVMHKTPLIGNLNPMIALENFIDLGRYQLLSTFTIEHGNKEKETYMRDKKNGEIFRPKAILPDYEGKEFIFLLKNNRFHEKEYYFELDLLELKQAYSENKLSGKLKELVSTLDEDKDNNVFMFVNFKSDDF